ncbi:HAD superfamily hydrolase (TIGR01509 family) [Kitasatospora sp. GP30]|uniref:HAD-IA family hydrolase n=1 Tax=Kitasatospora sp. GP30 TaxID=3035084 RepID=UPI000C70A634|nr:HAD-IA family hydrolase [Kitasatospora sp. GP30]MDH6138367.1 HAD superfamily hydrolase (TIGR01509 family) [Kitasatospora sp. GP30]
MNLPCLIVDIGGVLELTPHTGWPGRWERRLGLPEGAIEERMADVWAAGMVGGIDEPGVSAQLTARLGLDGEQLTALLDDLWADYLGSPNQEMIDYLAGLRSRCRIAVLSNSFVGAREREQAAYGFAGLAEHLVYSHEIGVQKPDPRAFAAALTALDATPAECLFIDDHAPNIEGARAVGMHSHLFTGNADAIARIERHLGG